MSSSTRWVCVSLVCSALLLVTGPLRAESVGLHTFQKIQLTDQFWTETMDFGDLNKDGHVDLVAGPFWYAGPSFKKRHAYAPAIQTYKRTKPDGTEEVLEGYEGALGRGIIVANEKFSKIADLNGDGWLDIIIIGFPGSVWKEKRLPAWFENPGADGLRQGAQWKEHVIADQVDNQSLAYIDLFRDGKPVLIAMYGGNSGKASGRAGYFRPDLSDPYKQWTFYPISWPVDEFQWYTHGLGYGDLNGDGRHDLLHSDGWWEQPASVEGAPVWNYNPYPFNLGPNQIKQVRRGSPSSPMHSATLYDVSDDGIPTRVTVYGGSQMYVDDLNGDGLADVVTSIVAHGYGLAWWEQLKERDAQGGIRFKRHLIINKEPSENKYGVKFTEMQAVQYVDIDGDGLKDVVTGKRFWSHGKCCLDPESNEPAVLYWFKQTRNVDRTVEFIPYLLDSDSGAGTQVTVGDVNADGRLDILVANMKGAFVFLQRVRSVSQDEWQKAQPKILFPDSNK